MIDPGSHSAIILIKRIKHFQNLRMLRINCQKYICGHSIFVYHFVIVLDQMKKQRCS